MVIVQITIYHFAPCNLLHCSAAVLFAAQCEIHSHKPDSRQHLVFHWHKLVSGLFLEMPGRIKEKTICFSTLVPRVSLFISVLFYLVCKDLSKPDGPHLQGADGPVHPDSDWWHSAGTVTDPSTVDKQDMHVYKCIDILWGLFALKFWGDVMFLFCECLMRKLDLSVIKILMWD